jgi:SagB-type dehydrogenase family enzyme
MTKKVINPTLIFFDYNGSWVAYNTVTCERHTLSLKEMHIILSEANGNKKNKRHLIAGKSILENQLLSNADTKHSMMLASETDWNSVDLLFHIIHHVGGNQKTIAPLKRTENISLPEYSLQGCQLTDLLVNRRSTRTFSEEPVTLQQFSWILKFALGSFGRFTKQDVDNHGPKTKDEKGILLGCEKFTFPIGGAINTIGCYIIANKIKGLKKAIYEYSYLDHEVIKVAKCTMQDACKNIFLNAEWPVNAAAIILLTTSPNIRKNYSHTYKLALLEAGHVLQTISLLSEQVSLGACEMGGINELPILNILNKRNTYETVPIAAIAIGNKLSK